MRRFARGAALAVVTALVALDVGAYVRGDYSQREPARDMAVGLGALAVVAAVKWALDDEPGEGAEVER